MLIPKLLNSGIIKKRDTSFYDSLSKELKDRIAATRFIPGLFNVDRMSNDVRGAMLNALLNGNLSFYAGSLPEVTIEAPIPNRNPIRYLTLNTYYPFISDFPFTGHSELFRRSGNLLGYENPGNKGFWIDKMSNDPTYNIVFNNCSDATRRALEAAFGKKINPFFFTTPGDVLDFAKENGGIKLKTGLYVSPGGVYLDDSIKFNKFRSGRPGVIQYAIPITAQLYKELLENLNFFNSGLTFKRTIK